MMKRLMFAGLVIAAVVSSAFAQAPVKDEGVAIETKVAQSLKTLTPPELDTKKETLEGQIIKLRFTSRGTDIRETKDGKLSGEARGYETNTRKAAGGSSYLTVTFPPEQKDWFLRISTSYESRTPIVVIGRVVKGSSYYGSHTVDILGREIRTDLKGTRIIW